MKPLYIITISLFLFSICLSAFTKTVKRPEKPSKPDIKKEKDVVQDAFSKFRKKAGIKADSNSSGSKDNSPSIKPSSLIQKDFRIHGTLYDDFFTSFHDNNDALYWGNYFKLRLKADWKINDNVKVHAETLYLNRLGEQNLLNLYEDYGFFNRDLKQIVITQGQFGISDSQSHFIIDQAYAKIKTGRLTLITGRHVIAWGPGYVFNPTDRNNIFNIFDPTMEYQGTMGFSYIFRIVPRAFIKGYFSLEDRLKKSFPIFTEQEYKNIGYGLKFQFGAGSYDISISYIQELFYDMLYDLNTYPYGKMTHPRYLGLDFSGELFSLGLYGEIAFRIPEERENRNESWSDDDLLDKQTDLVLGVDYTFENGLQSRFEYYRQSNGVVDKDNYDYMNIFSMKKAVLSKNYLYAGLFWTNFITYVTADLAGLFNIDDGSFVLMPALHYDIWTDVELIFGAYLFFGSKGSEFEGQMRYIDYFNPPDVINRDVTHQTIFTKLHIHF